MTLSTTAIFRNVDISGLYPRHETREADAERRTMQKHQMHVNFISERFIVDKLVVEKIKTFKTIYIINFLVYISFASVYYSTCSAS